MSTVECQVCGRRFAATFVRCVFCNAPQAEAQSLFEQPPAGKQPARATEPQPPSPDEQALAAARARAAAAALAATPRVRLGGSVAEQAKGHVERDKAGILAKRLIRAGILFAALGGLSYSCDRALSREVEEVTADSLSSRGRSGWVVVDGDLGGDEVTPLDVNESVPVSDNADLVARQEDLLGRHVRLSAACAAAMSWTTTWTYEDGRQSESTHSRIYCPVLGTSNRLWILSEPITVGDNDPRVLEFAARGTYEGVLRRLSQVTSVKKLREAKVAPGTSLDRDIPDDALVVVSATTERKEKIMYYAALGDTDGAVWLVTGSENLLYSSPFHGRFSPCPSKRCNARPWPEDAAPTGMIELSPNAPPERSLIPAGTGWIAFGVLLIIGGMTTRRWYPGETESRA